MIPDISYAVENAKRLMAEVCYYCSVGPEDLKRWFQTESVYPDLKLEDVLKEPLYVIHELVEISEFRKTGIPVTNDVFTRYPEEAEQAHYVAATVEMAVALSVKNYQHIEKRLEHIKGWTTDEKTHPKYKPLYAELYKKTKKAIDSK
jgi:hypothetical protein